MEVVNFKLYSGKQHLNKVVFGSRWYYIGPGGPKYELRASQLANPRERLKNEDPINAYGAWLWKRIKAGDSSVMFALNARQEDSVAERPAGTEDHQIA